MLNNLCAVEIEIDNRFKYEFEFFSKHIFTEGKN